MNTVGLSSNALFSYNFFEPKTFSWCKTSINIRSSLLITILFLCKKYVNA